MKLYFAPLEGITTCVYRSVHASYFGHCDAYYAPFITPSDNERITLKTLRDILPEKNEGQNLKVQIMSNNSVSLASFMTKIKGLGYDEINVNLGCPSGTVVKKGRGAGFLQHPDELDRFLSDIFSEADYKITLKTRIGYESCAESDNLIKIYNNHPLGLLIVHPRIRSELYKGFPHMEVFDRWYNETVNPICYNGDIFSTEDFERIKLAYPEADSVMIGRGAIANPAIFREIKGGEPLKTSELIEFTHILADNYIKVLGSDYYTLNKLKEIWIYISMNFPDYKKLEKTVKKSNRLDDFLKFVKSLEGEVVNNL